MTGIRSRPVVSIGQAEGAYTFYVQAVGAVTGRSSTYYGTIQVTH